MGGGRQTGFARIRSWRRILVLGSPGSGKTWLATRLGRDLGLEVVHLDRLFWKPGWIRTPEEPWRRQVAEIVARDSWIMDGTYEASLDLRLPAADGIVYLESSRLKSLARVVRRRLSDKGRTDAPPGQKLDRPFLRYIWRFPTVTRELVFELIRAHDKEGALVVLNTGSDVRELLRQLSG